MKRNLLRFAPLCLVVATVAAAQTRDLEPQPTTIEGATSHVYKSIGGVDLRLHVFDPTVATPRPRPAIVFFFGGGWTNGTVMQFVPQARHLAERGMVAIVADYRVFGRQHTSAFAAMADAKSAVRWVRAHAGELGVDPDRIAAAGGSAGGHIALSTAVFDTFDEPGEDHATSSKPNALVLFNPAVDLSHDSPVLEQRFDGRPEEGSPLQHLHAGMPPTLIMHGKADTRVPYADVERFCHASEKLGNQCQLIGHDGAGHGFFNPQNEGGKWYRETLGEMDRFLESIGYLSAAATASG